MKPLSEMLRRRHAAPLEPPEAPPLSEADKLALANLAKIKAQLGGAAVWSGWVMSCEVWHWIDRDGRGACGLWVCTVQPRLAQPGPEGVAWCWECWRKRGAA